MCYFWWINQIAGVPLSFLDKLNKAQREAVVNYLGPALVIAGAGSGKTRVLTYRVAHLLKEGIPAGSILALTFTNKAAREMKDRIIQIVGQDIARALWMGTFHSIFARILRVESSLLGYPSNYTIYDTIDSKSIIKGILKDLDLDDQIYRPNDVLNRISSAKNNLITAQAYSANPQLSERDKMARTPRISEVYKHYAARCFKAGAMDFDDLLLNMNILLRDFPEITDKYQNHFKFILVDEYQDTNFSQYLIINKLSAKHKNVCVVGDDAQSIYSFRGARIENILNFKNDYPEYTLFKLERNYRSTQTIVGAANSLIRKNRDQISKKIWSKRDPGEKINVVQVLTDTEEGFYISNSILDTRLSRQLRYQDFAVLYRTNAQSRIFEESLRKRNIPYRVYGGISFYQRKEIKDMLAYFRFISNQKDDESLKRIINYPARGIGKITLGRLDQLAARHDVPIWEVMKNSEKYLNGINQGTVRRIMAFTELIDSLTARVNSLNAHELATEIASATGILKGLHNSNSPEELSKYENIQELLNGIREFVSHPDRAGEFVPLEEYLENVSLLTDQDNVKDEDKDKVTLMTAHSAKGLEFEYIYIAGAEEDLFPSHLSVSDIRDLEEERRLFYVALTRAKEQVTISYTQTRYRWGNLVNCLPSRFIREIDPVFLDIPEEHPASGSPIFAESGDHETSRYQDRVTTIRENLTGGPVQNRRFVRFANRDENSGQERDFEADDPASIQMGMEVIHKRFGKGKVIHLEGAFPNAKATVFFNKHGQKQLLLKFAKLKIVR
ncbi:MAG: UvrD-helicase domain-containing protein [Bacteroidales bacterium]|nr:MAG: UvrD-helicase domain-containing protein [Bacteroidales bacterium]